jgi:hypothetical protein
VETLENDSFHNQKSYLPPVMTVNFGENKKGIENGDIKSSKVRA